MQRYVDSITDVVLDRSADELIGAILVALMLALALAGAFALFRRRITDATTLITCLALAMNLVAMTVAAGFIRSSRQHGVQGFRRSHLGVAPPSMAEGEHHLAALAKISLELADTDGNGLLSADEAAAGAEKFIRRTELAEGGPISSWLLYTSLRREIGLPPNGPVPGPPFDFVRNRPQTPDPRVNAGLESQVESPRPTPTPTPTP
jgi:hypothetical protein